jgi:peptide deformylase
MIAKEVMDFSEPTIKEDLKNITASLYAFRAKYGVGNGIAAPQIGILKRIVVVDLGSGVKLMVNPQIIWMTDEQVISWETCMCFPSIIVCVKRAKSLKLKFYDERGNEHTWKHPDVATSTLFQSGYTMCLGGIAVISSKCRCWVMEDTYLYVLHG